jgi:hypothetical protein
MVTRNSGVAQQRQDSDTAARYGQRRLRDHGRLAQIERVRQRGGTLAGASCLFDEALDVPAEIAPGFPTKYTPQS